MGSFSSTLGMQKSKLCTFNCLNETCRGIRPLRCRKGRLRLQWNFWTKDFVTFLREYAAFRDEVRAVKPYILNNFEGCSQTIEGWMRHSYWLWIPALLIRGYLQEVISRKLGHFNIHAMGKSLAALWQAYEATFRRCDQDGSGQIDAVTLESGSLEFGINIICCSILDKLITCAR